MLSRPALKLAGSVLEKFMALIRGFITFLKRGTEAVTKALTEFFERLKKWLDGAGVKAVDEVVEGFQRLTLASGRNIDCRVLTHADFIKEFKALVTSSEIRNRVMRYKINLLEHEGAYYVQYAGEIIFRGDKASTARILNERLDDAYKAKRNLDESLELLRKEVTMEFKTSKFGRPKLIVKNSLAKFRWHKVVYQKRLTAQKDVMRLDFEAVHRRKFIESIVYDENKVSILRENGFTDSMILEMKIKGKSPLGWSVHHKLPLDDGGTNGSLPLK